ncbi:hypothetical protein ScPMuIL_013420 [Solemya velum]
MSQKTLPLLFINLGGEMVYILDQRLRAQNIPPEKSKKVLHDIISTMFHERFMEELFKPQSLYSKKALRTVFDRLAHASIMRLNAASMDKLYDLMTMAFKYQVSLCLRPKDVLLVTLNHMDAIKKFVENMPDIKQEVDYICRLLIERYAPMCNGEFQYIRQTLLNFFQDMHIRVSIFLKDKVQNSNGRFVLPTSGPLPWGTEVPGIIKIDNQEMRSTEFPPGGSYSTQLSEGSFEMRGDRVTKLGTNMYTQSHPVDAACMPGLGKQSSVISDIDNATPDPLAKAQLDLLSQLIGNNATNQKIDFRLNLFKTDEEEKSKSISSSDTPTDSFKSKVVKIDASKKQKSEELNRIMGELVVQETVGDGADDLLDLMDSAY